MTTQVASAQDDSGGERVILVSGSYPPDVCGVGDYTERLSAAAPPRWRTFIARDWSIGGAMDLLRRLQARRPTTVVLQYPTQGYGRSLVPHLVVAFGRLTGRFRSVLALHEFGSLSFKGKVPLALAAQFAAHVIFTTEAERDRAREFALFPRRVETSVIPILSNIPTAPSLPHTRARGIDVAYFGHIRPNKGLEQFLALAADFSETDPDRKFAVIGEVPAGYAEFGAAVAARCAQGRCELILDLDDSAVARQLAEVKILYLPFPDGVSARRGSVLAGLNNGALIAATIGEATPPLMMPFVIACQGTLADRAVLQATLDLDDVALAKLQESGRAYLNSALPRDWAQIAALYDTAVGSLTEE